MSVASHEAAGDFHARDQVWLDALVARYHHRRYVAPDPLQFLYQYESLHDREIVGLIASSLAYGNVTAMLRAIDSILRALGPVPARAIQVPSYESLSARFRGFRYRFTTGEQIASLLHAAAMVRQKHDTLGAALVSHIDVDDDDVTHALGAWVDELQSRSRVRFGHLLPNPKGRSACKRLNLFLRWMVRRDAIDPGGWTGIQPRQLVIPLDTHITRIARERGWLTRRTPDLTAAIEVTSALRRFDPDDPVRFDFALTRPGIRREQSESPRSHLVTG